MTQEPDDMDLDLASRELCPDDACIGVLGPDGICPECGRSKSGAAVTSPYRAAPEVAVVNDEPAAAPAFDEDERELCPDDACIGLMGDDGRCRECGRTRQS